MEGKRTIEKIRLRNILSFGDKGEEIELLPLNVLIGQNASGKSNFIDIFQLLHSLTQDNGLVKFISNSGGVSEWVWKGEKQFEILEIEVALEFLNEVADFMEYIISYSIEIGSHFGGLNINREIVKEDMNKDFFESYSLAKQTNSLFSVSYNQLPNKLHRKEKDEIERASFLIYLLNNVFLKAKFYTDLQTTRKSKMREPQLPDIPNDFLEEDGSNLALVLNDLEHRGDTKDKIVSHLKKFNPRIKDFSARIIGGYIQLNVKEEGLNNPISAMRLSDGTLRYLCLLAILCHPEPPPLICLEEPEVGLHPDILPTIAELLIDASSRTQLIVTTHSDILVSALSDVPEAVLVCEADEDGTHFKRLDKENLKEWLDEYSLGEVWLRGGIGGTRW